MSVPSIESMNNSYNEYVAVARVVNCVMIMHIIARVIFKFAVVNIQILKHQKNEWPVKQVHGG